MAMDSKASYFLHLRFAFNNSMFIYVFVSLCSVLTYVGESVIYFLNHTYIICFFYIPVLM